MRQHGKMCSQTGHRWHVALHAVQTNAADKHSYVIFIWGTLLNVLWDCWKCHLLMCFLAGCLKMKLVFTVVCNYTPDCVSFVLQCKCGCYCTHDTWHKGAQTDYLLVFSWAVLRVLFTVTSCEVSTLVWRGILHRQSRTTGEPSCLFRSMEQRSNNSRLPCVERWCTLTRNTYKLGCLTFCSQGWVTDSV
jgi:hypothetical protein